MEEFARTFGWRPLLLPSRCCLANLLSGVGYLALIVPSAPAVRSLLVSAGVSRADFEL